MSQNSIAIIGKTRLAEELVQFCRNKGIKAALHSGTGRVSASTSIAVETLAGNIEKKKQAINRLDSMLRPSSTILTSCLGFSTTTIASWTKRPERVVGFATFYPLKDKKVIELARGVVTQDSAINKAEELFRSMGKETVQVKDAPGLIFPRILSLIINEAARSLDEGVARAEEIDVAMKLGVNYPLGPLRWGDQIGLDEVLAVLEGLQRETGDPRYRPSPLLRKMVLSDRLGEISGRGFFQYNPHQ
jgi:3-hydroxybutyryl-CoA dehydrogenase